MLAGSLLCIPLALLLNSTLQVQAAGLPDGVKPVTVVLPDYPERATDPLRPLQGTFFLDLEIDQEGKVASLSVRSGHVVSLHHLPRNSQDDEVFLGELRSALLQWRFSPAAQKRVAAIEVKYLLLPVFGTPPDCSVIFDPPGRVTVRGYYKPEVLF